jgi:hypothetical protein
LISAKLHEAKPQTHHTLSLAYHERRRHRMMKMAKRPPMLAQTRQHSHRSDTKYSPAVECFPTMLTMSFRRDDDARTDH